MPFIEGESIGPYTLMEQLGQGGMATVYKAYHTTLDRYVAIKVLHLAFLEEDSFLTRFQREAKAVAKLEHPNIIPIYDFAEHEGRPYLVMKYVEGETLKARLRKKKLDPAEILKVVKSIGSALDCAHQQGVLHRDVKPSNVLLATDGNIYLSDYGLARMAHNSDMSLTTDQVIGTPQYMSPEQAMGLKDLDGRTDIYSFGVMLYEMVTGQVPFNGDTPFAIIHDHIYTPLPLPRKINPAISEGVERVLLKALAKNQQDRYQRVADLVAAYESAIWGNESSDGKTISQTRPVEVQKGNESTQPLNPVPSAKNPKRRKLIWLVSLLAALVLCVSAGIWWKSIDAPVTVEGVAAYLENIIRLDKDPAAQGTPFQATLSAAQTIPLDPEYASDQLDQAIAAWRRADMETAKDAILKMVFASRGNDEFLSEAFVAMQEAGAWTLIGQTLFLGDRAVLPEMSETTRNFTHEVLYRAAEDPLSRDLFAANHRLPIFQVARLRQKMLQGSIETSKEELGKMMGQPELVKEFPEARLLEAELFVRLGDRDRALTILKTLMEEDATPVWIWDLAYEIQEQLN